MNMARKDLEDWIFQMGAEMQRLSSEMSPAPPKLARQKEWSPRVDVLESADHVFVKVELAGVRCGNFVIQYSGDRHALQVRGQRQDDTIDPGVPTAPHQLEIDYGDFAREVRLPDVPLLVREAQAQLANGILTIVIPKDGPESAPKIVIERTITVRRLR